MPHRTLAELIAEPIHGCANEHDLALMGELDLVVLDKRLPMADRAKALRHKCEEVMGLGLEYTLTDEQEVTSYLNDLEEMLGAEDYTRLEDQANDRGEWA